METGLVKKRKIETGNEAMLWAIRSGNWEVFQALLSTIDLTYKDEDGKTALRHASDYHQLRMFNELLTHSDPNIPDNTGLTVLMCTDFVKEVLSCKKTNVNFRNGEWQSALMKVDDADKCKLLLGHKDIKVNLQDKTGGHTALMYSIIRKNHDVTKLLLAHKDIDVNLWNKVGNSAILIASSLNNDIAFGLLINRNDINTVSIDHSENNAVQLTNFEHFKLGLSRCNVDVNCINAFGWTPLHYTAMEKSGNVEKCKLLLAHKAIDPNLRDVDGETALIIAAFEGCAEIVKLLLNHKKTRVNLWSGQKRKTAIMWTETPEILNLLLSHKRTVIGDAFTRMLDDGITTWRVECFLKHGAVVPKTIDYSVKINSMLNAWKSYLPEWNRFDTARYYPNEFKAIARAWLMVAQRLGMVKDIRYVILKIAAQDFKNGKE